MFGVCWVHNDFGGGGGYYVGNICRTTRRWWDGRSWQEAPLNAGPFRTREEAEVFRRDECPTSSFVYEENDPYGEKPNVPT